MRKHLFFWGVFSLLLLQSAFGQDWTHRHEFAKAYFGMDLAYVPNFGNSTYLNPENQQTPFERNGFITPCINIGGTHFWGYADFYVSISTAAFKLKEDEVKNSLRLGTFTGMRLYPLALTDSKIRPFIGYKFSPFTYTQHTIDGQSAKVTQTKSVFDIGLGIRLPKLYITLGYNRVLNPSTNIYISRNQSTNTSFPEHFLQCGINYMIETTSPASKTKNKELNEVFASSNRSGFFMAIGPSSVFPIGSSEYITEEHPYLDDKSFPMIFPDMALGYHFTKSDVVTALSFRPINQKRSALGFEQKVSRNSLVLESYKFLGDYHGFSPYLGLGLGWENIHLSETDNGEVVRDERSQKLTPMLVFGWDIRPSQKGDWWVLRTNLRYAPFLEVESGEKKISLQHLEFNFIQFVLYPQRLKQYRKGA